MDRPPRCYPERWSNITLARDAASCLSNNEHPMGLAFFEVAVSPSGHGLPFWRRSQYDRCTPDSCRLARCSKSAALGQEPPPALQKRIVGGASLLTINRLHPFKHRGRLI